MNVSSWRDFANTVATIYSDEEVMPEVKARRWTAFDLVGSAFAKFLCAASFRSRDSIPIEERS